MNSYSSSPIEIIRSLSINKSLIYSLIKRDIKSRYQGSFLGILWSFFNPIFMLAVYTFVFSVVFKAKWSGVDTGSKTTFALILFAGLIVFNFFAECVNSAPRVILNNANYVKKVIFPIETLPWVTIGSAFFHLCVSVVVWILFYLIEIGLPHSTIFLLPVVLFPIILLVTGLTWFLSALGVYIRDIGQIVGIMTTVLMFLSPIFFPLDSLPEKYHAILNLNPLAPVISYMRDILYWGKLPNITSYLIYTCICLIVFVMGFIFFQKTRKGFADVL
ncbi:ABC transporter permease [Photobacterium kishitanii]|uniref:ABC transporter permease n=1 Tax=Photobacterium kishitanii TaxID=318456 RepID=UPI0027392651|nr:ABC transporter permease [Photobacterium kishitanii]